MVLRRVDSIYSDDIGPELSEVGNVALAARGVRKRVAIISRVRDRAVSSVVLLICNTTDEATGCQLVDWKKVALCSRSQLGTVGLVEEF